MKKYLIVALGVFIIFGCSNKQEQEQVNKINTESSTSKITNDSKQDNNSIKQDVSSNEVKELEKSKENQQKVENIESDKTIDKENDVFNPKEVESVVRNFYSNYFTIAMSNNQPIIDPLKSNSVNEFVHPDLINNYEKDRIEYMEHLNCKHSCPNHIYCGQDYPYDFELKNARQISKDKAQIDFYISKSDQVKLTVTVKLVEDNWKIAHIECLIP